MSDRTHPSSMSERTSSYKPRTLSINEQLLGTLGERIGAKCQKKSISLSTTQEILEMGSALFILPTVLLLKDSASCFPSSSTSSGERILIYHTLFTNALCKYLPWSVQSHANFQNHTRIRAESQIK